MKKAIVKVAQEFIKSIANREVLVVSHYDTDGITSAAILAKTLLRFNKRFSIKIVKQLESEIIRNLPEDRVLVLLDLGSANIIELSKKNTEVFIIDHHEIISNPPGNVWIINPQLVDREEISTSGLTYLFSREISESDKELANLAVIGLVGDTLCNNLSKYSSEILKDSEVKIKRGLLIYPATRPINKALEYSTSIFIPGVTGNPAGVMELLQEAGIEKQNGVYKSIIELNNEESSRLITSILLRRIKRNNEDIIGNIYLVRFLDRLEDARELSALINASSRLEHPEIAVGLCLGSKYYRTKAEELYVTYKQCLVSALNYVSLAKRIEGKGYLIVNAEDKIKDTIIGTVTSIISNSQVYDNGTIIIAMAYSKDKIKVSARVVGKEGRNVREVLSSVVKRIGGECGGHQAAAGCLIEKQKELEFLEIIKKTLDIESVKI